MPEPGIEDVIAAAHRDEDDDDDDRSSEVGRLQAALRVAWGLMRVEERADFMTHDTVKDILSCTKQTPAVCAPGPWEPMPYSWENITFFLCRNTAAGPEPKCDADGRLEVFHTKFKAKRRANLLNKDC